MSYVRHIGIVSLSSGILGEESVQHEVAIGLRRLQKLGTTVRFMPHALKGMDYIQRHPEKRAQDLMMALNDPDLDLILCAIGGEDTYLTLPYLFENQALINEEQWQRKLFLGFSDTTVNHLAIHRLGLKRTFYGQSFLSDICELGPHRLSYSALYFDELLATGKIRTLQPSAVWFKNRTSYTPANIGSELSPQSNNGFQLLKGREQVSGEILGGCIDTIGDLLFPISHRAKDLLSHYPVFPEAQDWQGKLLLLETSENQMIPSQYEKILYGLKERGILSSVKGILLGQPFDRQYEAEYQQSILEVTKDIPITIVANLNIGHSLPRGIVPLNVPAVMDVTKQCLSFQW